MVHQTRLSQLDCHPMLALGRRVCRNPDDHLTLRVLGFALGMGRRQGFHRVFRGRDPHELTAGRVCLQLGVSEVGGVKRQKDFVLPRGPEVGCQSRDQDASTSEHLRVCDRGTTAMSNWSYGRDI